MEGALFGWSRFLSVAKGEINEETRVSHTLRSDE